MALHLAPGSRHEIPVRRPDFPFDEQIPRHWANGNALASHIFNALNLTFPDGERFFIKSVNDLLDRIDDPELARQARAFAGQEAIHGREHERYFEILEAQGYPIERFLRRFKTFIGWSNRLPRSLRVAMTAGAEHYTATLGHFALANPQTREFHPTMRSLILWHAAEEVEHKAVAFDVMQAAGIGYPTRILGYLLASMSLLGWSGAAARMLLRHDGFTRWDVARMRRELEERIDPQYLRYVRRQLRGYFRRDFHPNQVDDLELARRGLVEAGVVRTEATSEASATGPVMPEAIPAVGR